MRLSRRTETDTRRRIENPDTILGFLQVLRALYDQSEDLLTYFDREIPPPITGRSAVDAG